MNNKNLKRLGKIEQGLHRIPRGSKKYNNNKNNNKKPSEILQWDFEECQRNERIIENYQQIIEWPKWVRIDELTDRGSDLSWSSERWSLPKDHNCHLCRSRKPPNTSTEDSDNSVQKATEYNPSKIIVM